MNKEFNVFIIWENGRYMEKEIIDQVKSQFELLQVFEITWPEKQFHYNLAKFYGKSLPKGCKKEKECGCGKFLVLAVLDKAPDYVNGKNTNMTKFKINWRMRFGGKNYIHCSDCKKEGLENVLFLTQMSAEEILQKYPSWDDKIIALSPHISMEKILLKEKIWEEIIYLFRLLFPLKKKI